ncbi:MAG: hypothetical protein ACJAXS_000330 [Colwellia sp.]|jgi:hypothetical protein
MKSGKIKKNEIKEASEVNVLEEVNYYVKQSFLAFI